MQSACEYMYNYVCGKVINTYIYIPMIFSKDDINFYKNLLMFFLLNSLIEYINYLIQFAIILMYMIYVQISMYLYVHIYIYLYAYVIYVDTCIILMKQIFDYYL